jgi:hypothetical protein
MAWRRMLQRSILAEHPNLNLELRASPLERARVQLSEQCAAELDSGMRIRR